MKSESTFSVTRRPRSPQSEGSYGKGQLHRKRRVRLALSNARKISNRERVLPTSHSPVDRLRAIFGNSTDNEERTTDKPSDLPENHSTKSNKEALPEAKQRKRRDWKRALGYSSVPSPSGPTSTPLKRQLKMEDVLDSSFLAPIEFSFDKRNSVHVATTSPNLKSSDCTSLGRVTSRSAAKNVPNESNTAIVQAHLKEICSKEKEEKLDKIHETVASKERPDKMQLSVRASKSDVLSPDMASDKCVACSQKRSDIPSKQNKQTHKYAKHTKKPHGNHIARSNLTIEEDKNSNPDDLINNDEDDTAVNCSDTPLSRLKQSAHELAKDSVKKYAKEKPAETVKDTYLLLLSKCLPGPDPLNIVRGRPKIT